MATLDSDLNEAMRWLDHVVASWDFTRTGKEESLGRDLVGVVATGIMERSIPGAKAPDGGTWPANEAKYADYKRKHYSADQPNVRTGQMLSLQSLKGTATVISADAIEMKYGTGETPKRSSTGAKLTKGDQAVTDIAKAGYATPKRPFYALDEPIIDNCTKEAQENLDEHVETV